MAMKYCPRCAQPRFLRRDKSLVCSACGFELFLNAAAAISAIVDMHGRILACIRASDPGAGKLDLPGGFVDYDETAEQALQRELAEEIGISRVDATYVGSYPNVYPYKSVEYRTLDLVFAVTLPAPPALSPGDDVAGIVWIDKSGIDLNRFAFPSVRAALADYLDLT